MICSVSSFQSKKGSSMGSVSPLGLAAAVCVMALASSACTKAPSTDARLQAIYADEWKWREQQFPDNEDAQKPIQDHLPKVDPASQAMRLRIFVVRELLLAPLPL